jgi:hypothetical protein
MFEGPPVPEDISSLSLRIIRDISLDDESPWGHSSVPILGHYTNDTWNTLGFQCVVRVLCVCVSELCCYV